MFGMPQIPYGLLGVAGGSDTRPTNTVDDTSALQKLYASVVAHNRTPNGRVSRGFDQFGPGASTGVPTMASQNLPTPMDAEAPPQAPGALSQAVAPNAPSPLDNAQWPAGPVGAPSQAQAHLPPAAPQGVPMPTARPPDAPQATPDMGFFQRNSAMMRDPSSGAFIDPTHAESAQSQMASGPDVINKLMSYFHKKDNPL